MRCKAASAPQCEHCKQEPTQQRAGYGSQKDIYLWASASVYVKGQGHRRAATRGVPPALSLTTDDPKPGAGLDAHLEDEWGHLLAGTYGLCTRSGLPEDIAAKELAICVIKELTGDANAAPDLERLRQAVDLLDRASAPFAPHERARSSRHRYIDLVRQGYGLPTP